MGRGYYLTILMGIVIPLVKPGGGGSSYSAGTGTTYTSGYQSGNGQIIITY